MTDRMFEKNIYISKKSFLKNDLFCCLESASFLTLYLMDKSRLNIGKSGIIRIGSKIYKNVKINNLKIFAELGSGAFGIVTKRMLDNNILAVKEIFKMNEEQERKRGFMDLSVIKNANSSFIVKYYGYIADFNCLYICMEPMTMCLETLYKNYVQPQNFKIPEFILGPIAVAVVKALKYLEDEHGLIHRDIKPSNILINKSGAIKLCDFGIAAKLNDEIAMASSIGSFLYLSPERHARKKYDCKSDIWSLGISLFELATFKYPYSYENEFELLLLIIDQEPPKLPNTFSSKFQLFVNHCLIKDPNLRPTYKNLMNRRWFILYENFDANVVSVWFSKIIPNNEI